MRIALVLLGAVGTGCVCNGTSIALGDPGPIPVTGTVLVSLTSSTCYSPLIKTTGPKAGGTSCNTDGLDVGEAWVDDPALFQVAPMGKGVQVTAQAEGTTTLHARPVGGTASDVYDRQIEARRANRMRVGISECDAGTPWAIAAGAKFYLNVEAFADDVALRGLPLTPVNVPLATREPSGRWEASATPGTGAITSDHDRGLNLPIRVFTVGEALIEVPPPIRDQWGAGSATFHSYLAVDGRRACVDGTVHRYEVLTPDACNLGTEPDGGLQSVDHACGLCGTVGKRNSRDAGTCTVRVSIVDHPETPPVELTHSF